MTEPLVAIDTSAIREGKLHEVEALARELVAFVEANEPDIVLYQVYIDVEAGQMTVLQVHPTSASMEFHLEAAGPTFRRFDGLLELSRVDLYGSPTSRLLEQMRQKAALLGGAPVVVNEPRAAVARLGREDDLRRPTGQSARADAPSTV